MKKPPRTTGRTGAQSSGAARDIRVSGAVQGVGFRPFVHALATSLHLAGEVRNTSAGVEVWLEGDASALDAFLTRLVDDAPPLALIEDLSFTPAVPRGLSGFAITPSLPGTRVDTLVTADAATCDDCLAEIVDPRNRRYRYPFTNCTNCGPRFTITETIPYDRPHTTMAAFRMCPVCEREYQDPHDRRFHAQPNACPTCGPQLSYRSLGAGGAGKAGPSSAAAAGGTGLRGAAAPGQTGLHGGDGASALLDAAPTGLFGDAALRETVALLLRGGIAAIKGLGGYHLACDATNSESVSDLRTRKHRDERPFAIMVASVDEARRYCHVSAAEAELLASARRPVVLLERRAGALSLAEGVAPGVTTYGLVLPYTPLHHLLLADVGLPLVMTSGNVSDEPIAYRDGEAATRLAPLADAMLSHSRAIHMRTDDSVARVFRSQPYLIRRSRGYAPLPLGFTGCDREILAVGAHLKNTFCLTRGSRVFMSHHIGDLENLETLGSLRQGVHHFSRLFSLSPTVVAHDLHPDYLSTRFARDYAREHGLTMVPIQHHEAHIASVMADAHEKGPLIGVAFDGAGLGTDGTIWGGEFFVGSPGAFSRVGTLESMPLPGGDAAVREPWRVAVALLDRLHRPDHTHSDSLAETDDRIARTLATLPGEAEIGARPWRLMLQGARLGINTPQTSSAGRLFDGIAALLAVRHQVSYEGQAAILLETGARRAFAATGLPQPDAPSPWPVGPQAEGDRPAVLPVAPFVRGVLDDLAAGRSPHLIAARFHHSLAAGTADMVVALARHHRLGTVALSGGVFQNMTLLELLVARLESAGLRTLVHRAAPTNDGGLCLGQAEIAAALIRQGRTQP